MAKFRTQHERKTPLKAYADHRGPRTSKKLLGEEVRSHIKDFTHKIKGDKKVKRKRHDFHPLGQHSSSRAVFHSLDPTSHADTGSHPQNF